MAFNNIISKMFSKKQRDEQIIRCKENQRERTEESI